VPAGVTDAPLLLLRVLVHTSMHAAELETFTVPGRSPCMLTSSSKLSAVAHGACNQRLIFLASSHLTATQIHVPPPPNCTARSTTHTIHCAGLNF
jgi:hypothetical protein